MTTFTKLKYCVYVLISVSDGNFYVGLTDTDDVVSGQADGEPVEMVYPDQDTMGTLVIPSTVCLIRGAPRPETGRQLVDYLVGREVEPQLAGGPDAGRTTGFLPVRPDHQAAGPARDGESVGKPRPPIAGGDVSSPAQWPDPPRAPEAAEKARSIRRPSYQTFKRTIAAPVPAPEPAWRADPVRPAGGGGAGALVRRGPKKERRVASRVRE